MEDGKLYEFLPVMLCKIEDLLRKIGGNEEFSLTNGMDKFINRFVSVECPQGDKTIGIG